MGSTTERSADEAATTELLLDSGLEQLQEDCRLYNEAVGSYNTHLDNHRERRALYVLPFRDPITAHDACDAALDGGPAAIDTLLRSLIDEAHLDSQLRRHPRTYPIHTDAVEHLRLARTQLISTFEEILHHTRDTED